MLVVLSLICAFEGLLTSIICFSHLAGIKNEDHARAWVKVGCFLSPLYVEANQSTFNISSPATHNGAVDGGTYLSYWHCHL